MHCSHSDWRRALPFQSGLPAMNVEILSQFPSPPVPNLPALAMAMAPVMPQHQQQMMAKPPVSMAIPTPAQPVMAMQPVAPMPAPTNTGFIANFPPAQVTLPLASLSPSWSQVTPYFPHYHGSWFRRPKRMTMTSRTSKRLPRSELEIRPSLSSREIQAGVFPQQSYLSTKTGKVVWIHSLWFSLVQNCLGNSSSSNKCTVLYILKWLNASLLVERTLVTIQRQMKTCCCLQDKHLSRCWHLN